MGSERTKGNCKEPLIMTEDHFLSVILYKELLIYFRSRRVKFVINEFFNHLAGGALCDLDQLPEDGVVGALQSLDGYLLRHGALLDAGLQ